MAEKTAVAAGGEWKVAGTWSPEGTPTAADDCIINAASGVVKVKGANGKCRSLQMTEAVNAMTIESGKTLSIGTSSVAEIGGKKVALKITGSLSEPIQGGEVIFVSTSATEAEIYANGATATMSSFLIFNGTGKWKLGEELKAGTIQLTKGTLKLNGQTVKLNATFEFIGAEKRELIMDTGTVKFGSGNSWVVANATELTIKAESSLIEFTGSSGTSSFKGGGLTYNKVKFAITGTGLGMVGGSNTISELTINGSQPEVKFEKGTTTTVTTFVTNAKSGEPHKLVSTTKGEKWKLSCATTIETEWLELEDSEAVGAGKPFYDNHGTNLGSNVEWLFEAKGGGAKVAGTATIKLADSLSIAVASTVTGTTKLKLADSLSIAVSATVAGTARLKLAASMGIGTAAPVTGTSRLKLAASSTIATTASLAGASRLRLIPSASQSSTLRVAGPARVTFVTHAAITIVVATVPPLHAAHAGGLVYASAVAAEQVHHAASAAESVYHASAVAGEQVHHAATATEAVYHSITGAN